MQLKVQTRYSVTPYILEDISEQNVAQVVTDNASNCIAVGRLLEEKKKKLLLSPCAAPFRFDCAEISKIPTFYTITKAKERKSQCLFTSHLGSQFA